MKPWPFLFEEALIPKTMEVLKVAIEVTAKLHGLFI